MRHVQHCATCDTWCYTVLHVFGHCWQIVGQLNACFPGTFASVASLQHAAIKTMHHFEAKFSITFL